jgi:hypothetical protein
VAGSACAALWTGSNESEWPRTSAANHRQPPFGEAHKVVDRRQVRRWEEDNAMSVISRERSRPIGRSRPITFAIDARGPCSRIRAHNDMRCGVRPRGRRVWTRRPWPVYSISSYTAEPIA